MAGIGWPTTRDRAAAARRLRRELSAERARLVVEQVDLRRRAAEKFGDLPQRMFFTRVLLEQATDLWIARYKAARFASGGTWRSDDYCCGIGGDLIALAERGRCDGLGLSSEVACLLAEANLRAGRRNAGSNCGDVEQLTPERSTAWHLDPDRRAGRSAHDRRSSDYCAGAGA